MSMTDKIKITKNTNSFGKASSSTLEVSGAKLVKQLENITSKLGLNEKTLEELTKRIEKQRQLAEINGNTTYSTKDYLDQIKLEQATLGLSRTRLEYAEFLENYEKRIKEANRNAYKENNLYRAYQAIHNETNSTPTAAIANIGLGLATGGMINPMLASALHLDKLVTAPLTALTHKLLGIGHTTSSAIKNSENEERNEYLKKISDNVEGLVKNANEDRKKEKEKEEDGFFSSLLKGAAGLIGAGLLLDAIPGIPDWAKDYLPWAVGGFVFGGMKGLLAAVLLKFGWNTIQEFMGEDDTSNTVETLDDALNKFSEVIGVSPHTIKVALGGAVAGFMFGGVKGAIAGAIIALAGDIIWSGHKAKKELDNQFNENPPGTVLRSLGQGLAEQAERNGADQETVENLQHIDDAVEALQEAGSSYTTLKLMRHPIHPKGVAPWLTYAAAGIETASSAQKAIDRNGGSFDGIKVAGHLVNDIEQSWEETFTNAGRTADHAKQAWNEFSDGNIGSGLYHLLGMGWRALVTGKNLVWDDAIVGSAKLGGAGAAGAIGLGQMAFSDDEPSTSNGDDITRLITNPNNPYLYGDSYNFYPNDLTKKDLGFIEQSTEQLSERLKDTFEDPNGISAKQLQTQQEISDTLQNILKVQEDAYHMEHNIKTWERNQAELNNSGITGSKSNLGTTKNVRSVVFK